MAYSDDIANLGADHHWDFSGDSVDGIGAVVATDTTMNYAAAAIAEDASFAARMDSRTDRVSLATTTTINNSAQERKAVCGWFAVEDVELPICRIYGEGNNTTCFQFVLFPGNSVMLEVRESTNFQIQIYSDIALQANRAYHLCGIFEGSNYADEIRFYIDGVEQLSAIPSNRAPGQASLASRGIGEFGDPAGTVGIDGTAIVMGSPGDNRATEQILDGYYQHWAAWGDEADAVLTPTEVRETLFERGALAENTISTGAVGVMQTALDLLGTQIDAPLNIEIEAVSGGGDFTLDVDQTFNDLASMHIRYNGTADTLTIRKVSGTNLDASKCNAPFGGTLNVVTEVDVTITVKDAVTKAVIENAMVLLEADTGGPLTAGTAIIDKVLTNASGIATTTFDYSSDQPITGRVRKGTSSTYYRQGSITGTITGNGLDLTILLIPDE